MNEDLVREIENQRFTGVRLLREGYSAGEVDKWLDHLCERIRAGAPVRELIDRAQFSVGRFGLIRYLFAGGAASKLVVKRSGCGMSRLREGPRPPSPTPRR